ncbi:alpha/beta hydrolase family protein [Gordonia neofelifaecis]|uniref:Secretory lipase n=1 Tax=Gordonia neofelifaecis NRRL B-59395 TaxID=644548 RepID=F1YJV0_9ACTN|nr:lipase family protein [Gordonia neofelifaecis]EGD55032.1 hypothetical protein SCNU_10901 [Gordonia neofelifaecis NRRL B-59395]
MATTLRRALALIVAAGAVLATGPLAGAAPHTPAPTAGRLLSARPLTTAAALPSAARTTAITYVSTGATGAPIVVSGTVAVPRTPPPRGGWPTISWAHGTTGYADACAPSKDTAGGPSHDYLAGVDTVLDTWVKRGYAVVQTDYEGLGTPGGHPYINGTSEANTVADIVRAARALDPRIGRDWVAAGHSQGGQAALFTAEQGAARQPSLRLRGAVAIAPGGVDLSQTVDYVRSGQPGAEAAEAFLPLIVLGAQVARPSIDPAEIFSPAMDPMLATAKTGCLTQMRGMTPVPPAQVFRPNADVSQLTGYLESQDPRRTSPRVPVMIAQGTTDALVSKPGTDRLVSTLCGKNANVDYRVYDGADHRAAVPDSLGDAQSFVSRLLAGQPTPRTC